GRCGWAGARTAVPGGPAGPPFGAGPPAPAPGAGPQVSGRSGRPGVGRGGRVRRPGHNRRCVTGQSLCVCARNAIHYQAALLAAQGRTRIEHSAPSPPTPLPRRGEGRECSATPSAYVGRAAGAAYRRGPAAASGPRHVVRTTPLAHPTAEAAGDHALRRRRRPRRARAAGGRRDILSWSSHSEGPVMVLLRWALILAIIAVIAAVFGFTDIAGGAA